MSRTMVDIRLKRSTASETQPTLECATQICTYLVVRVRAVLARVTLLNQIEMWFAKIARTLRVERGQDMDIIDLHNATCLHCVASRRGAAAYRRPRASDSS